MKRRDLIINGETSAKGGLMISNKKEMDEFFRMWPNSYFHITCEVYTTKPLSIPMLTYYKKKIVPDFRDAFYQHEGERLTLEQTERRLRELSPIGWSESYNEALDKYEREMIEVADFDNQLMVFYLEHLKELGADAFGIYIQDPESLIR